MARTDLVVDETAITVNVNGAHQRLVPIYGSDKQDVLYVRVRSEYAETEDETITRAIRIVQKLK